MFLAAKTILTYIRTRVAFFFGIRFGIGTIDPFQNFGRHVTVLEIPQHIGGHVGCHAENNVPLVARFAERSDEMLIDIEAIPAGHAHDCGRGRIALYVCNGVQGGIIQTCYARFTSSASFAGGSRRRLVIVVVGGSSYDVTRRVRMAALLKECTHANIIISIASNR